MTCSKPLALRRSSQGTLIQCVVLFLLFACFPQGSSAQTVLSEGDIAFTYLQDGSKYSFVLLKDVDFGTQVVVKSNGSIITQWIAPVGGALAGSVQTVSSSDAKAEGVQASYGGAGCGFTGLAEISPKGFDSTSDECNLTTGQSIDWSDKQTVVYTGARSGMTAAEYLVAFNNSSNWTVYSGNGTNHDNTTSFTFGSGGGGGGGGGGTSCSIYSEDFESYPDNYGWGNDGANSGGYDGTESNWTLSGDANGDHWYVNNASGNNVFQGRDLDGESIWTSKSINVAGATNLSFSIDLSQYRYDKMENADYIRIYVLADGSSESLIYEQINDASGASTETMSITATSTVQFRIKAKNSSNDERHRFDNLELTGSMGTDTDSDCIDDSADNCTDTNAHNYADAANESCLYSVFYEPFTDASQFTQNVSFGKFNENTYWGIYDDDGATDDFGSDAQPTGIPGFGGIDGNILVAENCDDVNVNANPGILTWSNIDISSFNAALTFEIDMAEHDANDGEYIELSAKLSSDVAYTDVINIGSLSSIGTTLSVQTGSGSFDGSSLDVQLKLLSREGGDEIAIDDVRIWGTSCGTGVAITADAPTVALDSAGSVTVNAGLSGATVTTTSSGDCFTVSAFEVSKTDAYTGFAASVDFDCEETGAQNIWVRATDGSAQSAAVATTVTVQDTTPPTIGTLSGTYYLGEGGGSTASTRNMWWSTATDGNGDNCGLAAKKVSKTGNDWGSATNFVTFDCTELGAHTLYLQGTDAAGNVAEGSGTITIADNTIPTITAPATVNANTSAYGGTCAVAASYLSLGAPTTSDNCSGASVTNDAPSSYPVGTTIVTWTVTDASGNAATAEQNVVITDDQVPTTPTFSSANFQLSVGTVSVGEADLTISATDNCGGLTYEFSRTAVAGTWGSTVDFVCADATGAFQPIYVRATDATGNLSANGVGYVTISDVSTLEAIGQDLTITLDDSGNASLTAAEVNNGSVGNCGSSLSVSPSSFDCSNIGVNTVTLTISDGSVSDDVTASVTIQDTISPVITASASVSVVLACDSTAAILPADASALGSPSDVCTSNGNLIYQIKREGGVFGSSVSAGYSDVGVSFNVVVTAIDASGNAFVSGNIPVSVSATPTSTWYADTDGDGFGDASDSQSACSQPLGYVADSSDGCPNDANKTAPGLCGCGSVDVDVDSDGLCDTSDNCTDTSANNYTDPAASECQYTLYSEDFEDFPDNYGLGADGASSGGYPNDVDQDWTLSGNTSSIDNWWVEEISGNKLFEGKETDGEVVWTSPLVNVAGRTGLNFTADLSEGTNSLESDDYIRVYVKYDGGSETLLTEQVDDFDSFSLSTSITTASTVQFVIRVNNTSNDENHRFDNLLLTGSASCINTDVTVPTIASVSGGTIELDAAGAATLTASSTYVTASDDCSETGELTYLVSDATDGTFAATLALTCSDVGSKDVYFRVKDEAGNESASAGPATLTVQDVTPPNLSMLSGHSVILDGSGNATILPSQVGVLASPADACTVNGSITVEIKRSSGTYSSSVAVTCADVGGASFSVVVRATDSAGNVFESSAVPVTVTETVAGSCGCTDKTACNYSASATLDDNSCVFPGYECASPSSGQGYTWTVNAGGGDPCLCTAQSFDALYSEEFDDENFHYDSGGAELCSAAGGSISVNGSNWSWDCTSIAGNDAYGGFYLYDEPVGSGYALEAYKARDIRWVSKSIDITGYSTYLFDSRIMDEGDLDASDGWTAFAKVDGGTETQIANVTDDVGTSKTAFSSSEQAVSGSALVIEVELDAEGEDAMYLDDVAVSAWGKTGCTDPNAASGYDATAQIEDGSCTYEFATAYSRYDGGFEDKLWSGTACGGDCGSAPFLDAKKVAANSQTNSTLFNYVISSGTTVTVNGTTVVAGDASLTDLFVKDLTIENTGSLVIPAGKRLRVTGKYMDNNGNGVTGEGRLYIDGELFVPANAPSEVKVNHLDLPSTATLTVSSGKTLAVTGNLTFGSTDPVSVSGAVKLSGSAQQTISGDGATFDALVVSNANGVVVSDSLEIQGVLTLTSGELNLSDNLLVFTSVIEASAEEKTAVLDAIPASGASLTGVASSGIEVQRYLASDVDGVTISGYTLFSSPIAGSVVGDLAGISDFYLAGWPGTNWPNSFSTVLFWDETNSAFVEPTSNSTPLDTLGGAWIALSGSQTPTMSTTGTLNSHVVGDSKTFGLTRSDNANTADEFEGWNLIYNPYQARLDWHAALENSANAALVEDQYAVYDTQSKQFVRYSETNGALASASRYIEPGQSFWVRVPQGTSSGTLTLTPSMIDNSASGAEFVRSVAEGELTVLIETRNAHGATESLLRFNDLGDAEAFMCGDLSRLSSSAVRSGELAFLAEGQQYVAKTLPHDVEGELYVRSRSNMETTMRVLEVKGDPAFCGHIEDTQTGELMMLQEGEELVFTLPQHDAAEGRFLLKGSRFAPATGIAPDCPDSESGTIVLELGDVVADILVLNYETMNQVGSAFQATGTQEFSVEPGEYAIQILATETSSECRVARRQVMVAPGEQPELLGLNPQVAECNVGMAALAFELYGEGVFEASLIQDSETVWSENLPPGEHVLEDIAPGDYLLKVSHPCLETTAWALLSDPGMPSVTPVYPFYTDLTPEGAWLEATCLGCQTAEGHGYHWIVDGEMVGQDAPLEFWVEQVGAYEAELVAYGPDCEVSLDFEMLVGKHKAMSNDLVRWGGVSDGLLFVTLESEWTDVSLRWHDSAGRLLRAESSASMLGTTGVPLPQGTGWVTLEMRSANGEVARWSGLHGN